MKWKEKFRASTAREDRILRQNQAAVNAANARMLDVILVTGIVVFALLWGLTFLLPNYRVLRVVYGLIIVSLICIHVLSKLPTLRTASIVWLYCAFCVYAANTAFCGIFIIPDSTGVMILGCLVLLPTLTLDYSWRADLFEVLIGAVYLLLILPHKAPAAAQNEIINVCFFAATALAAGGFQRRARLENFELERQAGLRETTDYLTGLGNRRQLFDYLSEKEKPDCPAPITGMLMLDIDNFKLYNDSYGHIAGDECLRRLGACLQNLAQSYPARFFRYGGEEFLAASSEFSREEMYCFCEKIADEVRHMNIQNEAVEKGRVTVSIGFTVEESPVSRNYEQMISRADSALYEAKRTGRDRVVGCRPGMRAVEAPSCR